MNPAPVFLRSLWCAAFALTACAASRLEAQQTLRWKFAPGQKLPYDIVQKMDMQMDVAGRQQDMTMNHTIETVWVVKSVAEDGTATIGQQIKRVKLEMDMPMIGKFTYDSDKKEKPDVPFGEQLIGPFAAMVGSEFVLKMTPTGNVTVEKMPKELEDFIKKQAGGLGGMGFSVDQFKQMASNIGAVLPEKPVNPGDTWQNDVSMDLPFGAMKVGTKMKYEGTESRGGRSVARIGTTMDISMKPKAGSPFKIEVKDSKGSGTVLFDVGAGRLVKTTQKQQMKMSMDLGGQSIDQTINQTVEVKQGGGSSGE